MITKRSIAISEMFKRILKTEEDMDDFGTEPKLAKPNHMISKVTVLPDPFQTVLTLDVTCAESMYIIVRMFSQEGKIVKMFSWYLVKGTNVTAINDVGSLKSGLYRLDIIDNEGTMLFSANLTKA